MSLSKHRALTCHKSSKRVTSGRVSPARRAAQRPARKQAAKRPRVIDGDGWRAADIRCSLIYQVESFKDLRGNQRVLRWPALSFIPPTVP